MTIDLLQGARADLARVRKSDPDAFAVVMTFLQEAEMDKALIQKFTSHGDIVIGSHRANVKAWVAARRGKDNLFRARILDTPATVYRVVYGYDWYTQRIGILAVVHRDEFDYEITGEVADRIKDDWKSATGGRST